MTSKVIGQPELDGEIVKLVVRMHSGEGREGPLPELADVYAWLADVIRRIEGRADDEKRGGVSDAFHYYDALYDMAEWWSRPFPKAATAASNLAEWCKSKDQHDFTPPADADAIAASERRGADKREQEIIGFIDRLATTKNSAGWIADRIRQGDHLYGGESDDA